MVKDNLTLFLNQLQVTHPGSAYIIMGYWPSMKSKWLDIGYILFLRVYGP